MVYHFQNGKCDQLCMPTQKHLELKWSTWFVFQNFFTLSHQHKKLLYSVSPNCCLSNKYTQWTYEYIWNLHSHAIIFIGMVSTPIFFQSTHINQWLYQLNQWYTIVCKAVVCSTLNSDKHLNVTALVVILWFIQQLTLSAIFLHLFLHART